MKIVILRISMLTEYAVMQQILWLLDTLLPLCTLGSIYAAHQQCFHWLELILYTKQHINNYILHWVDFILSFVLLIGGFVQECRPEQQLNDNNKYFIIMTYIVKFNGHSVQKKDMSKALHLSTIKSIWYFLVITNIMLSC